MKVGTIVTAQGTPFAEYQILAFKTFTAVLIDVNSKKLHEVSSADLLINYRYFYHSNFKIEPR